MEKLHEICEMLREYPAVPLGFFAFVFIMAGAVAQDITGTPKLAAIGFLVGLAVGVLFCKWPDIVEWFTEEE